MTSLYLHNHAILEKASVNEPSVCLVLRRHAEGCERRAQYGEMPHASEKPVHTPPPFQDCRHAWVSQKPGPALHAKTNA